MRLLAMASSVFFAGCSVFGHSNVKTPDYQVIQKDGDFEIRQYPQLTLVLSQASGSEAQARRTNFNRLFKYIQGNNTEQQKYQMTAPVLMQPVPSGGYNAPWTINRFKTNDVLVLLSDDSLIQAAP